MSSTQTHTYGDVVISSFTTHDLRFPTSHTLAGSDAMNEAPDYSAAYVILQAQNTSHTGHGFSFTIGRGNDLVTSAAGAIAQRLVGKNLAELTANMGQTWRYLVSDSQVRWVGPEKGVIHLALAAVVNGLWDLWAKLEGKPVWKLVADMSPEEFVRCIDFTYIEDAITPLEALDLLKANKTTVSERLEAVKNNHAITAYSTEAGWLGYSDEKMRSLISKLLASGCNKIKLKVGRDLEDDIRRCRIAREMIGMENMLMVDANQVWGVTTAIEWMKHLAEFKPTFIEEPTSPDDILGHARIREALKPYGIGVATGEMCHNRVMFKQLLQAEAIDFCQIDACRLGGVNEVLAVMLMAKKFSIPIVPHSGGIGLNEYTQQLSLINYLCVAPGPCLLENITTYNHVLKSWQPTTNEGYFVTPLEPGYGVEFLDSAVEEFSYPKGSFWVSNAAATAVGN